MRETIRQYLLAGLVSVGLFAFFSFYLFARRGYYDLSIANKVLGSGSLALLTLVLLLGPLSRLYQRFDSWLNYRKELGIIAFLSAVGHVYLSMFVLAKNPLGLYQARPLAAYSGLAGLLVLAFLFIISFEKLKARLEYGRWWKWQYRGARLAGLLVLTHLSVLKFPGWIDWLTGRANLSAWARPGLPPASMLVGLFALFVLVIRLAEIFGTRFARIFTALWLIAVLVFSVWLFLR